MKLEKNKILKYVGISTIMIMLGILIGLYINSNGRIPIDSNRRTKISQKDAETIALENAKKDFKVDISLDIDVYVELEKENGKEVYEIEFILNGVKYEYTISAMDGIILEKERDLITNGIDKNIGIILQKSTEKKL